ncbi:hypothetical protein CPB86DRAFT_696863 [Serendipita vermifera]|nr:hypothetical protein CPB86DRAFT_696863 [Serendipita vermifera]
MPSPATKRSTDFPKTQKNPRTSLDQQTISSVDTFLKSLRKISRGSNATLASHTSETRILQQTLYKSRNQHHNALFWRNCTEIKRYSSRIEEVSLGVVFDSIRASFYEEPSVKPNEWKTAPWTHLPEGRFFGSIMERLQAQAQLYEQVNSLYCALCRFGQSGSFLPLVLGLSSLTSRLYMLTWDLHKMAQSVWDCLHSLLASIEVIVYKIYL